MSFILMAHAMKLEIPDPYAKWLLLCLADYANEDTRSCFPSIKTLSKRTSISESTLYVKLNWLEEHGYLTRISGSHNKSNVYTIHLGVLRETEGVLRQSDTNLSSNLSKTNRKKRRGLYDGWKPSSKCLSNLKEKYGELNYEDETDKFINYHLAKGSVFINPERAYLNWIRNAVEYQAKDKRFREFKKNTVSSKNGSNSSVYARLHNKLHN